MRESKLNILLVNASQRNQANSALLARYIQKHTLLDKDNITSSILDLSDYSALLGHYGFDDEDKSQVEIEKQQVLAKLYQCDAVVFITPEWGGMIPPALVNLLLLTANGSAGGLPLGHKPAMAIGVSTSAGGSNPVTLLKAYSAKNSHLVWLPLHAIIHNVEDFLQCPWTPNEQDRLSQLQSRVNIGIESLVIYAEQLKPVRESLVALSKTHPFGQ
ncbi:NADPH-dependent oxidoreductase [Litorilituus sediminis]|uniref:NADPH-dependent oxidoreductase n=1 Tax=Litorilituus sediminis TaxID=718192 RepID=A0A4P6P506_9GAMM|nr:NADPH-dependent oxidoreductase [Litorilituus sediminis]